MEVWVFVMVFLFISFYLLYVSLWDFYASLSISLGLKNVVEKGIRIMYVGRLIE